MYTKQETFDLVVKHLLEQGVPSYSEEDHVCLYRHPEGSKVLKCAVGCLIPDDMYDPSLEGRSVVDLRVHTLVASLGHAVDLVGDLQQAHDGSATVTDDVYLATLRKRLVGVANSYQLSTAVLDT